MWLVKALSNQVKYIYWLFKSPCSELIIVGCGAQIRIIRREAWIIQLFLWFMVDTCCHHSNIINGLSTDVRPLIASWKVWTSQPWFWNSTPVFCSNDQLEQSIRRMRRVFQIRCNKSSLDLCWVHINAWLHTYRKSANHEKSARKLLPRVLELVEFATHQTWWTLECVTNFANKTLIGNPHRLK